MSKATPGPWSYSRTHLCSSDMWFVICDPDGYGPIADVGGKDKPGQIAEMKHLITDPAIIEANARQIAAAPELLEALRGAISCFLLTQYAMDYPEDAWINKGLRAVAKAEGRER